MIGEIDILHTAAVAEHLNRNPRVVSYRDFTSEDVVIVTYDSSIPVPAIVAHEARELGLEEVLWRNGPH